MNFEKILKTVMREKKDILLRTATAAGVFVLMAMARNDPAEEEVETIREEVSQEKETEEVIETTAEDVTGGEN